MPTDAEAYTSRPGGPSSTKGVAKTLDPVRQRSRLPLAVESLAQHDELVGAEAGDGVGRPEHGTDALGQLDQEIVASRVAQAFVDVLEAVHVYEEHCQQPWRPGPAGGPPPRGGLSGAHG